jgi:glycosyltransferase involved in cell wall biosynthesis
MNSPLVSIITPTFARPDYLPNLSRCVLAQDLRDFEWLILDDSNEPSAFLRQASDPRVVYIHDHSRRSVGAKRNMLIERARGQIIAHFDDDDYYASNYLSSMVRVLRERDVAMAKLFGFFLYSNLYKTFGYWDLTQRLGRHMIWSKNPMAMAMLTEANNAAWRDNHLGYGFSYVYKKEVCHSSRFPDANWNEDLEFIKQVLSGFAVAGVQDSRCTCLHVLHQANTSMSFPQYLMPPFLLDTLFPDAKDYVAR